ncbi:MAG: hypothetical protein KatS3mg105_0598 [Gemmatales bacterium]|nr:MAG: hypothetical protein KatS3mg105_0598 [Gemmatales bacterium]
MSTKKITKNPPATAKKASKAKATRTAKTKAAASAKTPKDATPPKAKAEARPKKLSAIDAAAQVLAETGQAMTCKELIEVMASKGLWASPAGKTPHATLYAAILREIARQGDQARFQKTERGKFASANLGG